MSFRVGIDIGGTFTDAISVDEKGNMVVAKSPTTPNDLKTGIMDCLDGLAKKLEIDRKQFFGEITAIVHGTTQGTNTIASRSGPRIGIISTRGHKDTVQLRRVRKDNMWDWRLPFPQPLVPRHLRVEVDERLNSKGEVLRPLNEADVHEALAYLMKMGVTSIVVTLLFSFLNPGPEKRIREIIKAHYPEALVTLSHEVLSASGEYERFSTAVIDAYVRPALAEYIQSLKTSFKSQGFKGQLLFMQNNGGCVTAEGPAKTGHAGHFRAGGGPGGRAGSRPDAQCQKPALPGHGRHRFRYRYRGKRPLDGQKRERRGQSPVLFTHRGGRYAGRGRREHRLVRPRRHNPRRAEKRRGGARAGLLRSWR
jgi:N-methylhydantoinase A